MRTTTSAMTTPTTTRNVDDHKDDEDNSGTARWWQATITIMLLILCYIDSTMRSQLSCIFIYDSSVFVCRLYNVKSLRCLLCSRRGALRPKWTGLKFNISAAIQCCIALLMSDHHRYTDRDGRRWIRSLTQAQHNRTTSIPYKCTWDLQLCIHTYNIIQWAKRTYTHNDG